MERLPGRKFKVTRSEFPITVEIAPKNAADGATTVIVGHLREVKNGRELDERDADITEDDDGVQTYDIAEPEAGGSLQIVQTLVGFFGKNEEDTARFDITISTSKDQSEKVTINRPTINPGVATLTFQI